MLNSLIPAPCPGQVKSEYLAEMTHEEQIQLDFFLIDFEISRSQKTRQVSEN